MKYLFLILFLIPATAFSQIKSEKKDDAVKIHHLINHYSEAREKQDTVLLKSILTNDVDQLVSSGEWRTGIREAVDGMLRSSTSNPGTRTLEVEKIRFLEDEIALVDCRYTIKNPNGTERNMWSTFVVLFHRKEWKIAAIRNMNPTGGN
ncbi:SgcJ/EcaC family oxidoreductase [Algoriphagus lacus]|uniref:SgcJ/EcaC family oxidoreductase n=1 Tax=Algoriphagus lacus TaxID=2056311 RepID=A0A418PUB6_9BACT|nr:nuclear transport factor 2 family protein [Algoriphagus lacus]RIW17162.1 SgcJ/EcaC family oxidoreductase [Algoriphagus lacus]